MKKYKHIFFDLDRTLWDFEQNAEDTLQEMFEKEKLSEIGIKGFESFHAIYKMFNKELWHRYQQDEITKDYLKVERFYRTLKHFGIIDYDRAERMGKFYIERSPEMKKLFPYSHEILEYLQKEYQLHIITNGFNEVQFSKLKNAGLYNYFEQIITSEIAGSKKPSAKIFEYALHAANADTHNSLMIGDDAESDIHGGSVAGIDQIFVDYSGQQKNVPATYTVHSLKEIEKIL